MFRSIVRLDVVVARWMVDQWPGGLKTGLARLSNSANFSKLWFAIGAVQAVTGGRAGRRAAQRGLLSMAVASFLANAVMKPLFPRPRPPVDPAALPGIVARPSSSSFPSGHSASSAAYAVASAFEAPAAAAPIAALAAGVAVSRVTSGVHYPSDVVIGAAVGAAVAWGSTRAWPLIDDSPAKVEHAPRPAQRALSTASATGRGVRIVANPSAGTGATSDAVDSLRQSLPDAIITLAEPDQDLIALLADEAEMATVLGVFGGDGSVSAAATVAIDQGVPLVVFPGGTLNHFARDLGLDSVDDSIEALKHGEVALIDVGTIDGRTFVNTASFGVYSDFVAGRERLDDTIGKWPAMIRALASVLRYGAPSHVVVDGEPRSLWMIFVGNGAYDPPGFAPATRADLACGVLDVRMVDAGQPGSRLRLVASLVTGTLGRSRVYERSLRSRMTVDFGTPTAALAADGEVFEGSGRFVIEQHPGTLQVIVPRSAATTS